MLLVAALLMGVVSAFAEDAHQLIYGATTEIAGDFSFGRGWFTNNATDAMIVNMTEDCATVTMNKEGAYIVNPTVSESVEGVMNEDGTKTYTVKVKDGLVFNNGEIYSGWLVDFDEEDDENNIILKRQNSKFNIGLPYDRLVGWYYE